MRGRNTLSLVLLVLALLAGFVVAGRGGIGSDANKGNDTVAASWYPKRPALNRVLLQDEEERDRYKAPVSRWEYDERYNPLTGDKYEGGFVNPLDSENGSITNPDDPAGDYMMSTAALGLPFFILMLLFLFFYLVFGVVRLFCCCCGRGCCPRPREEGYSPKHRLILRIIITCFTVAIVVGAILLYVSAAQIPASLGTGDDGFVGVTVDNTNQMLDIVTNMVDIIDEASNGILGQVDRLDELLTEYDIAEFDAEAIKDIIRAGTNATADFKDSVETVQADIEGAVVDVDDYMAQVNTVIAVVSAILGAFAIIVLVFVWLGWKFFMVLGFVVSPLFVTGCMLLAGIGIIFSTFLSDICFELQNLIDVFRTEGADAASEEEIAAGMLPCLEPSEVDDVIRPLFQFGNTCVYLAQLSQVGDKAQAERLANPSAPLPVSAADRPGPCFRFDPACEVDLTPGSDTFNEQCLATCAVTTEQALGNSGITSAKDIIEPRAQWVDPGYTYNLLPWDVVLGNQDRSLELPISDGRIEEFVSSRGFLNSDFQELMGAFLGVVGNVEEAVGIYDPDLGNGLVDNLEFLGRCGHIELLAGGVADDVCPGMDNAFALFYQGFAVMGCGYVLASVAWLFGIQRLGKNALEGEGESMEKEDMDKKDGDDEA